MKVGYATIIAILFLLSAFSGGLLQDKLHEMGQQSQTVTDNYNVVLITVDALRSDHVSCYGYKRDITPNMCGATEEPIVFENAYAQAPWSLQSFTSLITGRRPFNHGVTRAGSLPSNQTLIQEVLNSKGYRTGAFVDGGMLARWSNFHQGFNTYRSVARDKNTVGHHREVFRKGFEYLNSSETSSFVFLHTMEVHHPYRPENLTLFERYRPANYSGNLTVINQASGEYSYRDRNLTKAEYENLKAGYDTSIKRTDRSIGKFMSRLNESGELNNTIIIITSDHGESFRDHGRYIGHTVHLYEEYIKVPLIIHHPNRSGMRIEQRVRLIDVAPTIMDFLGTSTDKIDFDGKSLVPLLDGKGSDRLIYSSTYGTERGLEKKTVIRNDLKLIWNLEKRESMLFNLNRDPDERTDLSEEMPEKTRELKNVIQDLQNSSYEPEAGVSTDKKIKEKLDRLGYSQ